MLDLPVVGDLKVPVVGHLLCVGEHLLSASSVTRLSVVAATLDQISVALSSDIHQLSVGLQGGEIGMGRGVVLSGAGMLVNVRGGSFVPCGGAGTLLGDVITKEGPMGEDRNLQVAPEGSLTQMVVNVVLVTRSSWKVNLEVTAVVLLIDTRTAAMNLLVKNLNIVRIKKN